MSDAAFKGDNDLANPPSFDEPVNGASQTPAEVDAEPVAEEELFRNLDGCSYRPVDDDYLFLKVYMRKIRQDPAQTPTPTAMAKLLGRDYSYTASRMSNPAFVQWLHAAAEVVRAAQVGGVHEAVFRRAVTGDTAAAKLFMERFDPRYVRPGRSSAAIESQSGKSVRMDEVIKLIQDKTGASKGDVHLLLSGKARIVPV